MPHVLPLSLRHRRPGRIRPELGPLRGVLARLGDPQLDYPSILIVGTNGKGSTAVMLEAVLGSHGVVTGLTTSPHLVTVEERIRVGGRPVDRDTLAGHLDRLSAFDDLTFFETITAAAFLVFAEARLDLAILEAGMGGTWDATRVANSSVAGVTNVGCDHAGWLGASRAARARDKGAALAAARWGVIGPGVDPEVKSNLPAPEAVTADELVRVTPTTPGNALVEWDNLALEISVPLAGAHQVDNLHLALALARAAEIDNLVPRLDPATVRRGLAGVRWPGRLTMHEVFGRRILLDGAHNLDGARALAAHLERLPESWHLLFSCLDDKEVEAMAEVLEPVVGDVVVCPLDDERAMPLDRMAAAFGRARRAGDLQRALDALPDPVVAAGSLRLVGALLEAASQGAD